MAVIEKFYKNFWRISNVPSHLISYRGIAVSKTKKVQ